jgi:ABC-type glycerol-3-phosphate transport system substrate-binding protein
MRKILTKTGCIFMTFILILMSACGRNTSDLKKSSGDTLTILVGNSNNLDKFISAIQEKFPDINFDIEYYSGPNTSEYIRYKMSNGETPDIVLSTQVWQEEIQEEYLLDLSGYDFVDNFSRQYLNKRNINGAIYLLPSPYTIGSLLYNKTLFEEMGWEVPTNHEEFVNLIKQIRNESDITPVTITGRFGGMYFRLMTSLSQCDFLNTVAGKKWESDFAQGNAGSEEGFGEGIELLKDWIDAGAFDAEDETNRDSDVYTKLIERRAAFAFPLSNQSTFSNMMKETTDEFGAIPFYGLTDESVMLTENLGVSFGLGKQLGEPGNESKLSKALSIMEYFSTEEGQNKLVTGDADILPLAGVTGASGFSPYEDIWQYVESGYYAETLYIGYEDIVVQTGEIIKNACFYGGSLDNLFSDIDTIRQEYLSDSSNRFLVTIKDNMTHEDTVKFIADFLLEQGGGDLSLVSEGGVKNGIKNMNGVSGKLYAGTLEAVQSNMVLPGSATADIVNVTMTGKQIMALLESGRILQESGGQSAAFAYTAGGITYDVKDGKVSNVKFSDGSALEENKKYSVSMVANDFVSDDSYVINDTKTTVSDAYYEYLSRHDIMSAKGRAK